MPIEGFKPGDMLVSESAVQRMLSYQDSVRALHPVLDSIQRELNEMYQRALDEQARADSLYGVNYQRRDSLMNVILDAMHEAAQNEGLMYASLREVEQRSKQARRHQRRRDGFLRWLFYHPATTPTGRILLGGMSVTFTALTVATIISLTSK